jgi:hypothetical protein
MTSHIVTSVVMQQYIEGHCIGILYELTRTFPRKDVHEVTSPLQKLDDNIQYIVLLYCQYLPVRTIRTKSNMLNDALL